MFTSPFDQVSMALELIQPIVPARWGHAPFTNMAELVLPRVLAMVLCDDVVEADEEIGVFHLTGVRTVIDAGSFPTIHSLCVFVQMTGHNGEADCRAQIECAETGDVIGEADAQTIAFEHPTIAVPVLFRFPSCVFATPGLYFVEMFHENKQIGKRRLDIRQKE